MINQTQQFEQSIEASLRNIYQLVEQVLIENIGTRKDDWILTTEVWKKRNLIKEFDENNYIVPKSSRFLIVPESVGRVRRKIQNYEKRLLPTKREVMIMRGIKEEVCRKWYTDKLEHGQTDFEEVEEMKRNGWLGK